MTILMQAAKRNARFGHSKQAGRDKGMRQNRYRPGGLPPETASAALRRLAMERPLPAHRAFHPSVSGGNALREIL
ncbi:MAG: hypothetical protein HY850_05545 [Betaproteobacteria bacterium]|nr:hypothetical protein [Betaproteobacteria bacterium]